VKLEIKQHLRLNKKYETERSKYKDVVGKVYHYTTRSPNHSKLFEGARIFVYIKEINTIIGFGKIGKILSKRKEGSSFLCQNLE
jgi:hypothetical protein